MLIHTHSSHLGVRRGSVDSGGHCFLSYLLPETVCSCTTAGVGMSESSIPGCSTEEAQKLNPSSIGCMYWVVSHLQQEVEPVMYNAIMTSLAVQHYILVTNYKRYCPTAQQESD